MTYYVITKGRGVSEWLRYYVIFALSYAEFDYGRGSRNRPKVIT